eukprot:PITA_12595
MQGIKEIADSSKKARNPRYEESNAVSDKIKKHYLILALSSRLFGNLAYCSASRIGNLYGLILTSSEDDFFLTGADPLICKSKRELDSIFGMIGAKNLLRYLRGTISHGLRYTTGNVKLHDYSNSLGRQCGGSQEHFWVLVLFGFCSISWMSRKQKTVALSTVEIEYIATSMTSCEAAWLRKLFSELFDT